MIGWSYITNGKRVEKMANFRQFHMSFWTDNKIEEYSVDEKFLYLFFLTNPLTNLCGCYEVSYKKIADFTGLTRDKAEKTTIMLVNRGVIDYSDTTGELLILKWYKYNWTTSEKFRTPLKKEIDGVKDDKFREYLTDLYNNGEADYTISEKADRVSEKADRVSKPQKQAYGENGNVLLTEEEYNKLIDKHGAEDTAAAIEKLDIYLLEPKNKKKYKSHYAAMLNWVFKAVEEDKQRRGNNRPQKAIDINDYLAKGAQGYETRGCI